MQKLKKKKMLTAVFSIVKIIECIETLFTVSSAWRDLHTGQVTRRKDPEMAAVAPPQ